MQQLVIVSNRLPVSVKKENGKLTFHPSIGGLATGLGSYAKNKKNKWVGWPGVASDELTEKDRQDITAELRKHNCYPVFLTKNQLDSFYSGYSNSVLWPLFHDLSISDDTTEHMQQYWQSYKRVNAIFADVVLALSQPDHTIWVHDYQLLLLPSLLRAERPVDRLGFFLHIPFPSAENFCELPQWQELTTGMLGAAVVGFHTESYTQNFLDVVAKSSLGLAEQNKVVLNNRVVRVTDFPIGIDYDKYVKARKSRAVTKEHTKLLLKYRGKKVILTVDRLDPAKGLVERVTAFQTLLEKNPELRGKVVMVMLVVPSRVEIAEYAALKSQLEKLIRQVNHIYGNQRWQPIQYLYTSLSFEKVTALYRRADVAFIAPIRDGMNLVAKEYIASQPMQRGVLVLSKSAGAAEQLKEAIMVDHTRPNSLVLGLKQALLMPQTELRQRAKHMQKLIEDTSIQRWAGDFVRTLSLDNSLQAHNVGLLNEARQAYLTAAYKGANKRLLLLDYDGTLAPFVDNPDRAAPSKELKQLLKSLSEDPKNTVVIISGRGRADLETWFGGTNLGLVAEHGAFTHKPEHKYWHKAPLAKDTTWQKQVIQVLEKYAAKTPGSFVEKKESSVVWHFRRASPYHAQKYLVILKRLLSGVADDLSLDLRQGNMILEVRPNGIHKGGIVAALLANRPDFVLAIGDDYTDEDTFVSLPDTAYTIKVGRGRTAALMRAKNISQIRELLGMFAN